MKCLASDDIELGNGSKSNSHILVRVRADVTLANGDLPTKNSYVKTPRAHKSTALE